MHYCLSFIPRKNLWRGFVAVMISSSLIATYFLVLQSRGNFHEIIPGELYRSAQLSPEQLEMFAKNYNIRTIVNLRGSNPNDDWYKNEVAVSDKLNLKHIDYRISRKNTISLEQSKELAAILRDAPKPILIHCKAGIDRTGFVTAVYLAAVANYPDTEALEQFCFHYGFIALGGVPGYKMFESFNTVKAQL